MPALLNISLTIKHEKATTSEPSSEKLDFKV